MTDRPDLTCSRSSASSERRLAVRSSKVELPAAALTAPPAAVDWFAKLTVPLGMYGNDQVGDCVVAAIHPRTSWSLGAPRTRPGPPSRADHPGRAELLLVDQHRPRGPGLVTQTPWEAAQPQGSPLQAARVRDGSTAERGERPRGSLAFSSRTILSVEVDRAQYYRRSSGITCLARPSWATTASRPARSALPPIATGIATWGYVAELTDAYVASKIQAVDGHHLALGLQRPAERDGRQAGADFKALTGRTLPPQVLPPTPARPRPPPTHTAT